MFIHNSNHQILTDFLKDHYPEIFKSINDEGYILEYLNFHAFKEIHFKGNVVGFLTLDTFHIAPNDLSVNECYIVPEYRGNDLLYNELFSLISSPNINIYLKNPNKALIKVLYKNGIASKISSNLYVSYIDFIVTIDKLYTNPKIKKFYKRTDDKLTYKSDLFDMDLCSVLFLDPELEYVKYSDVFALTVPRKIDLKKYKLRNKLKRVNESYLIKCHDVHQENIDEILDFYDEVVEFIKEVISVDNALGTNEVLTPDFITYLAKNNLSQQNGFDIINHINRALDEGNLTPESCKRRMQYLVENIWAVDNVLKEHNDDCPFCGKQNLYFIETCEFCGQKIKNGPYDEELVNNIANFDIEKVLDEIKDEIDSGELFGVVEIEDNDPLLDLKIFYNKFLTGFDFEEIKRYFLDAEGDSLVDTIQDYFDSKIMNEEDEESKFQIYIDYLCSFFFYYLDEDKFNEALSIIIQLVILSSNDMDIGEGNIIEGNPHSMEILYLVDIFLNNQPDFDLDCSFNLAVDNFKVEKWLNNQKEALDAISKLL
ncbi:hypothetical protein [Methanobrevibacter sp.]